MGLDVGFGWLSLSPVILLRTTYHSTQFLHPGIRCSQNHLVDFDLRAKSRGMNKLEF